MRLRPTKELQRTGEPESFLVIDPGKRTGLLTWEEGVYTAWTCLLDELPAELAYHVYGRDFVAVEAFRLVGGVRNNDPDMPSSVGIGMARMACYLEAIKLYEVQRNVKRAGHQALDAAGQACYAAAKNDHMRDVTDMAGFLLRETRLK